MWIKLFFLKVKSKKERALSCCNISSVVRFFK